MKILKKITNSKNSNILSSSGASFLLMVFGLSMSYLLVLVLAHFFGPEGVGIYSLFVSVLTLLGTFAALGLGMSTLRFIGELKATNNEGALLTLYILILRLTLPVALFLSGILFFVKEDISRLFNIDSNPLLIYAIIVAIPVFTAYEINIRFLQALNNIKLFEFFRTIYRSILIVFISLLIFMLDFSKDVLIPVWIYILVSALAVLFLSNLMFQKLKAKQTINYKKIKRKELLNVGLPLMLVSFGTVLMTHIDNIMISSFIDTEAVGIYTVAFNIAFVASLALIAVNTVVASKFSEQFYKNDFDSLKESVSYSTTLTFIGTLPIALIIFLFPDFLLGMFGNEFSTGEKALLLMTCGQLINALSGSVGILLSVTGHQKAVRNIIWLTVIINVSLNYVLIPIYGIEGAAIATASSLAFQNILMVIYAYRELKINTLFTFKLKTK